MSSVSGAVESLSRSPAVAGRKPAAGANAAARPFALPERANEAPRGRPDADAPARPDRGDRPEAPGRGAAHRAERANAVAQGSGTGTPARTQRDGKADDAASTGSAPDQAAELTPEQVAEAALIAAQTSDGAAQGVDAKAGEPAATSGAAGADPAASVPPEAAPAPVEPAPVAPALPEAAALAGMVATATTGKNGETDEQTDAVAVVSDEDATQQDQAGAQPAPAIATPDQDSQTAMLPLPVATPAAANASPVEAGASGSTQTAAIAGSGTTQAHLPGKPGDAAPGSADAASASPATGDAAPAALPAGETPSVKAEAAPAPAAPPVLPQGRTGAEPLPRFNPADMPVPQNGPPTPETRPTPVHGVPMEIGFRSLEGQKRFDIRLDPGELGRVEVRLDIGKEGDVKATLTVDRPETLQLMQRESRALERALEQAGFRPSDGSIDLRLSDRAPDRGQGDGRDPSQSRNGRRDDGTPEAEAIRTLHPALLARHVAAATGGVDLVI